jgi:hypothetical protein
LVNAGHLLPGCFTDQSICKHYGNLLARWVHHCQGAGETRVGKEVLILPKPLNVIVPETYTLLPVILDDWSEQDLSGSIRYNTSISSEHFGKKLMEIGCSAI